MSKRWTMIGVAFLSQNLAIGITFGSYGLLIGDIAEDFSGSLSQVSLGIALIMLAMGMMSPVLGYLLDRWSIRGTMMIGAVLTATGFQLAARADSLTLFLVYFGLVVGTGVAAMGVLPAAKLAANWFPHSTGKALGFVSLPVLIAFGPPLFGMVIVESGWRELFKGFSYAYLALLPILALVRDRPVQVQDTAGPVANELSPSDIRWRDSLTDRRLWLIVLIGGVMFSGGIVLVTHIVQHAVGNGIDLPSASLLLSLNGISALVGAMLFGWLCDRLSPIAAIAINIGIQALIWPFMLLQTGLAGIAMGVVALGICGGGAHPALSALVESVFGAKRFGTMLGQITLLVIPFNFSAAPLAGLLYDVNGSYVAAFGLLGILCLVTTVVLATGGQRLLGIAAEPSPISG